MKLNVFDPSDAAQKSLENVYLAAGVDKAAPDIKYLALEISLIKSSLSSYGRTAKIEDRLRELELTYLFRFDRGILK